MILWKIQKFIENFLRYVTKGGNIFVYITKANNLFSIFQSIKVFCFDITIFQYYWNQHVYQTTLLLHVKYDWNQRIIITT